MNAQRLTQFNSLQDERRAQLRQGGFIAVKLFNHTEILIQRYASGGISAMIEPAMSLDQEQAAKLYKQLGDVLKQFDNENS